MSARDGQEVEKMDKGKITISKVTENTNRDDWIRIQLQDKNYKTKVIIEVELRDFASALTGMGNTPCTYKEINKPHPE